jgi:hypothetical protein
VFTGLAFIAGAHHHRGRGLRVRRPHERVATSEQLHRLPGRYNDYALKSMVDNAPHDPNEKLADVKGQLDPTEIKAAVDNVRGDDPAST